MTISNDKSDIRKGVYAESHPIVRLNSFRFEHSPYIEKYVTDQMLFAIYCNRFYPLNMGENVIETYWKLRQGVLLYDVPEKPLEIKGPDAVTLLERVFTRRIDTLKIWRARYAIACTSDGNVLMDGVLIRLADDHFWYVKANGEFETWLKAFAEGLDVTSHRSALASFANSRAKITRCSKCSHWWPSAGHLWIFSCRHV